MSVLSSSVLCVEDSQTDRFLIRRALRAVAPSLNMDEAESVHDAVNYLNQESSEGRAPVWVFIDLNLPDGSGLEVVRQTRQLVGLERLPLIILSTSNDAHDVEQAFALGVNAYICKPDRIDDLKEVIRGLSTLFKAPGRHPYAF